MARIRFQPRSANAPSLIAEATYSPSFSHPRGASWLCHAASTDKGESAPPERSEEAPKEGLKRTLHRLTHATGDSLSSDTQKSRFVLDQQYDKIGSIKLKDQRPEVQHTLADLAAHYALTVLPARPRRPKDKGQGQGQRSPSWSLDPPAHQTVAARSSNCHQLDRLVVQTFESFHFLPP